MKKIILVLLSFLIGFTFSCNKDENNETPDASGSYTITIAGQIKGENGLPLVNASIQVGNKSAQTDNNGIFLIEKVSVNKTRAVVKATKSGYWDRAVGFIPNTGAIQYCNFVMPLKTNSPAFQSATGGTLTISGATLIFPPNAFVTSSGSTYSGMVTVTAKHLPVNDPNFGALIPGGDLMAESTSGDIVKLESYGMIGVEISDNLGNSLQLAPGKLATIQLPIDAGQLAGAAATIPLWYFDESKNMWVEEGFATKQGNKYIGEVAHFSWWNCDEPFPPATIQGYVYDCNGLPLANVTIYHNNNGSVYTNQNGFYSGQINSTLSSTVFARFGTITSGIVSIPALTAGQIYNVPDFTFSCDSMSKLKMQFVDCNNMPVNPMVYISNGAGYSYIQPINGSINTLVPCGTATIIANYLTSQYVNLVALPCFPDSLDLGTIVMCDTASANDGSCEFDLSSPSLNISYLDTVNVFGLYDVSPNSFEITSYNAIQSMDFNINGSFPYQPGTYLLQGYNLFIDYYGPSSYYFIYADTTLPNLYLTIIKNGIVGDTMEVSIQGNVTIMNNSTGNEEQGIINNLKIKCIRN
ncbi:MAG: carboxypeptidase regulatory-like domain-containing protein [Bacteroidetes bacterium]|nr:carboxypeptidase regulatory-like domain-containing protein [Bacteroidota bacterium]